MKKEELEKEAEVFVSEKADKGNFDIEQFGKAYFSENSMKQALIKFTEQRKVHTEIEINGVRFSNISEMLQYMDKQRERIAELEKENAELKSDNDARKFAMAMSEKVEKQLREENAELKRDKEDLIFVRNQSAKCMCEDKERLTKAKELLKTFMKISEENGRQFDEEVYFEAREFLKE